MKSIEGTVDHQQPVIFLGSSTGMYNQIETCHAGNRKIAGIIDPDYPVGSSLHGLTVLDPDLYLPTHYDYEFFVATTWSTFNDPVFVRNRQKRQDLLAFMHEHNLTGATLIHPTAVVSPGASIGRNVSIGALSYVSHGAVIHDHVMIREQCFVGHDTEIQSNAILQIRSTVTGLVVVEPNTYVGVNSTIVNRMPLSPIYIGENSLIYPGELVLKSVSKNNTVRSRRLRS